MSIETQTSERLHRLTADVVGGPDLGRAIRDGRRDRRRRTARLGIAAAAVTGLGLVVAWQVIPGSHHHVAVDRADTSAEPSYHDFVTGTQVDEQIQAAAADHLPGLPEATDVFPSDWEHDGMNPPVDYQDATEWQAYYEPTPNDHMVVFTGKEVPNRPQPYGCSEAPAGPYCSSTTLPDGSMLLTHAHHVESGPFSYWFANHMVRPDGSVTSVVEHVSADSWAQAEQRRAFSDAATKGLVDDPRLLFPDPLDPPPAPKGW